jgi:hypothetical protein
MPSLILLYFCVASGRLSQDIDGGIQAVIKNITSGSVKVSIAVV